MSMVWRGLWRICELRSKRKKTHFSQLFNWMRKCLLRKLLWISTQMESILRAPLCSLALTHSLLRSITTNQMNWQNVPMNFYEMFFFDILWYARPPFDLFIIRRVLVFFIQFIFSLSLSSTLPIVLLLVRRVFFFFICLCFISFVAYILKYE